MASKDVIVTIPTVHTSRCLRSETIGPPYHYPPPDLNTSDIARYGTYLVDYFTGPRVGSGRASVNGVVVT